MKVKPASKRGRVVMELDERDDRLFEQQPPEISRTSPAFRLKRILVPTDFSAASRKALRYAQAFARQFGPKIVLLNVIESTVYPDFVTYPILSENEEYVKATLQRLEKISREEGIDQERVEKSQVRYGSAFLEIARAAKDLDIDLIVISTHGYTGLKHIVLGSTAERVVRYAPCPVLIVREHEHEFIGG